MFLLKSNSYSIRLNAFARTCKHNKQYDLHIKQLRALCISAEKERKSARHGSFQNITSISQSNKFFYNRTFSSESLPKDPNIFGDIGTRKYDQVELDEVEQKVNKFEENEAKIPQRYKLTPGQYADLIKSHVTNGDLSSAEKVLEIAKKNRDQPTLYMYSLIIRAYSLQGDVKKCFRLYNRLKQQGLKPNDATINSLFNACSNSTDDRNLEVLHDLRSALYNKNFPLNDTHYNTLIKAYSRHNQIEEAFQLLDEMRDKKLRITDMTFNNLLHGASSHKECGLKFALVVWHLMKFHRIKPNIYTYNLLFKAIRDTELGDVKINDVLISESEQSKIIISDGGRPDLLANPPVVRSIVNLDINPESRNKNFKDENTNDVSLSTEDLVPKMSLNEIIKKNKLILFGGFDGLMKRMEDDRVLPNVKSLSLCLELIPNTKEAERHVINYARNKKIPLDTSFYNILIKRRCFRYDYDNAKAVLADMEKGGCKPDIFTWGVTALACQFQEEGEQLLQSLDNNGITPNYFIYGSLIRSATDKFNIEYILYLMESMARQKVKPSNQIFNMLDQFKTLAIQKTRDKDKRIKDLASFQIQLTKFKLRYAKWTKLFGRNDITTFSRD